MFYLYKNRNYLSANNTQRNRLSLILLRHMTTLINKIVDSTNNNSFNMDEFEAYKSSPEFSKIYKTA